MKTKYCTSDPLKEMVSTTKVKILDKAVCI